MSKNTKNTEDNLQASLENSFAGMGAVFGAMFGNKDYGEEKIIALREANIKLKKTKGNEAVSEMFSIIADILEENRQYRKEINHNFEVCNDSLKWILDKFED